MHDAWQSISAVLITQLVIPNTQNPILITVMRTFGLYYYIYFTPIRETNKLAIWALVCIWHKGIGVVSAKCDSQLVAEEIHYSNEDCHRYNYRLSALYIGLFLGVPKDKS